MQAVSEYNHWQSVIQRINLTVTDPRDLRNAYHNAGIWVDSQEMLIPVCQMSTPRLISLASWLIFSAKQDAQTRNNNMLLMMYQDLMNATTVQVQMMVSNAIQSFECGDSWDRISFLEILQSMPIWKYINEEFRHRRLDGDLWEMLWKK